MTSVLLGKAQETNRRALIWEYTNYANFNLKRQEFASKWVNVIQMDGFKMTEDVETDSFTLFNLTVDPYETKEVSKDYPEIVQRLKTELEQWKQKTEYEQPRLNPDFKSN